MICQNQKAEAVVAAVIHAHDPDQSHTSAAIHAIHAIVHCPKDPKTDITHDPVHLKIMVAPVAHPTETKAWTIKLTLRTLCKKQNASNKHQQQKQKTHTHTLFRL